jgi:hypothetical protein
MHALAMQNTAPQPTGPRAEPAQDSTLDLSTLARVGREDRIEVVAAGNDCTQELFDRTVRLIDAERPAPAATASPAARLAQYVPEHADLRKRFIFAEAIGSYSALHDLLNGYSPAYQLFANHERQAQATRLSRAEVQVLEDYRSQVHGALGHASRYLHENLGSGYSAEELRELNDILLEARERYDCVTAILGMNLIHEVGEAVRTLHELEQKMRSVQPTIDGIFLVGAEFMFVPANDLIRVVNCIFAAVGNPYVARHIDGIMLLAARNLLIQVVSFYSYYGRQQIYGVFKRRSMTLNQAAIAHHIRAEIRGLFRACKAENRLILKRVMANAEREFELSVESIREEAEAIAIAAVDRLLPAAAPPDTGPPPGWLRRLANWLFR